MFRKTDEVKVLRDPVHGYIHVDYEAVWQCINSAWFQRLRSSFRLLAVHRKDRFRYFEGVQCFTSRNVLAK